MSTEYDWYLKLVKRGTLPDLDAIGLSEVWGLTDKDGWTLAHEVVRHGYLPATFNQWDLTTDHGWTVGHEARSCGRLPHNFDRWGLADDCGASVLWYVLVSQTISSESLNIISRWHTEKPLCKTEADWGVFKIELPEIYSKYTVAELFDDTFDSMSGNML
jgi:hypothetical protein